ncbi:MAG: prepilin-type N-terminal cleavage/methylation domain-containing protein, partial [Acidobacteriota bacterium]
MSTLNRKQTQRQEAGFTLVEMLIAMTIFMIAVTVAFLLYDNAQRSFKRGEESTEQQQVTRVAFDKLLADLRMAGYNYDPTGNPIRTDEQIEGAWATAVTIRGDFDFEDPTKNTVPESTLDNGVFDVVSTGNDEIVTYMLAKDAGNIGGDTLTFFADVQPSTQRDTTTEQVDVNNTALTVQSDPPYTLYRVILDTFGTPV